MIQQSAQILWNQPVGPGFYRLGLGGLQGYRAVMPGQFVMLQIGAGQEPLLRRPFSIFGMIGADEPRQGIELLYKVVGRGTKLLAARQPGQALDLLGPLGRGFDLAQAPPGGGPYYLAAGGIGVAPIRFLAQYLIKAGYAADRCRVFLGGRNASELLARQDFEILGMPVITTTDDGSAGDRCLVTAPLAEAIQSQPPQVIFACGPPGMLKCTAGLAEQNRIACQLSMECLMACGIGVCLGCAVEGRPPADTYFHVCKDGPVFAATALKW